MFKVMLVDDEKIIRESISMLIPWETLGLKLVASCKNGIEAYNALQDETPDIVMTDIRMPVMSGIDLIKKAYYANLNIQFIILSGYNDFEYAQCAMKYGVKHYLLKPCNENQIISVLKETINDCYILNSTRQLEKQQIILKNTLLQNTMISLINDIITNIYNKKEFDYDDYKQYLDFEHTPYKMLTIKGLEYDKILSTYEHMQNIHLKYSPSFPFYGLYANENLFLFTVDYNSVNEFDELIGFICKEEYNQQKFKNFKSLLSGLIPQILYCEYISYINGNHFAKTNHFGSVMHGIKDLCNKICDFYTENDTASINEYFNKLKCFITTITDIDFLLQICGTVFLSFSNNSVLLTPLEATECILKVQSCDNIEEIREFIIQKLDYIQIQEHFSKNHLISRIQKYVKEHISDPNLTLKWIAENYLYMNVDYVSRKFIKETGNKFSTYLTNVRVQNAKELIASGEVKNIDFVAEQVGLGNNPQYFNQIFKKHTGMTINAYAASIGKNNL